MDTSACYSSQDYMEFSSDERKWINKIRKLKETHPDEVDIIREPEENDGCIYARVPCSWLRIQPKYVRNYSDEEISAMTERIQNWQKNSRNNGGN